MPILMLRHAAVSADWAGLCYGQTDVSLSADGRAAMPAVADRVQALQPSRIISSDLTRATKLAALIGPFTVDPRLRERHQGSWEAQPWDTIHAADPTALDRLMDDPSTHPAGGESLNTLAARIADWLAEQPPDGLTVATAHSGPIAAAAITALGTTNWFDWLVDPLAGVCIDGTTVTRWSLRDE